MTQRQSFMDRHYFLLRRLHSISGVIPIGAFLIFHLTTNSAITWGMLDDRKSQYGHGGVATYLQEVGFIHEAPFLLLTEIFVLWLPILFHGVLGVYYARTGRHNIQRYGYQDNWRYTLMRVTGYIAFVFIFYHVATLRWGWNWLIPGGTAWDHKYASSTMAAILQGNNHRAQLDGGEAAPITIAGVLVSLFYLLGVTAAVFHFANGLWTAAITWGLTISQNAMRRWGRVCAVLGAGLMLAGWSSVIAFMTLDVPAAAKVEKKVLNQTGETLIPEPRAAVDEAAAPIAP